MCKSCKGVQPATTNRDSQTTVQHPPLFTASLILFWVSAFCFRSASARSSSSIFSRAAFLSSSCRCRAALLSSSCLAYAAILSCSAFIRSFDCTTDDREDEGGPTGVFPPDVGECAPSHAWLSRW